jgi:hypothetical protein
MKFLICLILFYSLSFTILPADKRKVYSPDKSKYLIGIKNLTNNNLKIMVFLSNDSLLNSIQTDASFVQKWSITWVTPKKLLVESSDIGDYYYLLKNKSWKKIQTNSALSHDFRYVACVYYGEQNNNAYNAIIEIGTPNVNGLGHSVNTKIKTKIPIVNLKGSIIWLKPDLIKLIAKDGNYYWKKKKRDWFQVNYDETTKSYLPITHRTEPQGKLKQ